MEIEKPASPPLFAKPQLILYVRRMATLFGFYVLLYSQYMFI